MEEEQSFLFGVHFPSELLARFSCSYCNFEVLQPPTRSASLHLLQLCFDIPCFSKQLVGQYNIFASDRLQCKSVLRSLDAMNPTMLRAALFSSSAGVQVHLRELGLFSSWGKTSYCFSLHLPFLYSTSLLCILLFSPCTILYLSSHDASLMDPRSFK